VSGFPTLPRGALRWARLYGPVRRFSLSRTKDEGANGGLPSWICFFLTGLLNLPIYFFCLAMALWMRDSALTTIQPMSSLLLVPSFHPTQETCGRGISGSRTAGISLNVLSSCRVSCFRVPWISILGDWFPVFLFFYTLSFLTYIAEWARSPGFFSFSQFTRAFPSFFSLLLFVTP